MKQTNCYLNALGMLCAPGDTTEQVRASIASGETNLCNSDKYAPGVAVPLGLVTAELPNIPLAGKKWQSRNNQLALAALLQIKSEVDEAIEQYGAHRVAVIIGTSTSGIAESEPAIKQWVTQGTVPNSYHYSLQEMGAPAQFIAEVLGTKGPTYGISTACSSGAKALASARRLISAGFCDAVVAGGVDSLCQLTVQGFSSLQAVSDEICNPFSINRKGINIGEGAALFLVSNKPLGVKLAGAGESSDAHHISAPDPNGNGALKCMQNALNDANVKSEQIGYINLHGTATPLNDQMESKAVHQIFGDRTLCSSTKPFTGHTLGAAGAIEVGICWLMLVADKAQPFIPSQIWDAKPDPQLPPINLVNTKTEIQDSLQYVMSNSFAFGGNNISLLLERIE